MRRRCWRFLLNEPGGAEVASRLDEACMSTANLAEVLSKTEERGGDAKALVAQIARTPIEMVPLSVAGALAAARMRPKTMSTGVSLGDRICLALAEERGCEAWTVDKRWASLKLGVAVHLIRRTGAATLGDWSHGAWLLTPGQFTGARPARAARIWGTELCVLG